MRKEVKTKAKIFVQKKPTLSTNTSVLGKPTADNIQIHIITYLIKNADS